MDTIFGKDVMITINNIVDNCITKKDKQRTVILPSEDLPDEKNIYVIPHDPESDNSTLSDDNKFLKDFFTKFIVDKLFTEKGLYNFLFLINEIYVYTLQLYCQKKNIKQDDIIFIFKGGNIMRMISNEFKLFIPGYIMRNLNNFYEDYFKRSDADFGILINPFLKDFDDIYDDITGLSYYILTDLIEVLLGKNITMFLNWFNYNHDYKKTILKDYFDRIKDVDISKNETWKSRTIEDIGFIDVTANDILKNILKQSNLIIRNRERYNTKTDTFIWGHGEKKDYLYTSYNESISFNIEKETIKFNLTRTKINFNVLYSDSDKKIHTKNIGGELIDVSISHKDDTQYLKFYKNIQDYIAKYSLKNYMTNTSIVNRFSFQSYSLVYLFYDLYKILFVIIDYPWHDEKYEKRINRIFYISYIDLLSYYSKNTERLKYLNSFLNILEKIKKTQYTDENKSKIYNEISKEYSLIKNKNVLFDLFLNSIISIYRKYVKDESETVKSNEYISFYDKLNNEISDLEPNTNVNKQISDEIEFLNKCSDNLYILIKTTENMDDFCD